MFVVVAVAIAAAALGGRRLRAAAVIAPLALVVGVIGVTATLGGQFVSMLAALLVMSALGHRRSPASDARCGAPRRPDGGGVDERLGPSAC